MNILFLFLTSSLAFLSHLLPLSLLPPRSPSFLSILSFHFWSSSSSLFFLHNSLPLSSSFDLELPFLLLLFTLLLSLLVFFLFFNLFLLCTLLIILLCPLNPLHVIPLHPHFHPSASP